jgi:hypothetical protein
MATAVTCPTNIRKRPLASAISSTPSAQIAFLALQVLSVSLPLVTPLPSVNSLRCRRCCASATGSVGGRTTWADSEAGDADKMSESQDMDMDTSSVGGMSEEGTGSLVGFGESGTRTPARQSVISNSGGKSGTPTARDMRMNEASAYNRDPSDIRPGTGNTGSAAEQAERIMRDNMDTTSNDRMLGGSGQKNDLGKFGFEK